MPKHFVYIIRSTSLGKFYVGETHDIPLRIERHNGDYYDAKWTKRGRPWELFFSIQCNGVEQAKAIEKHIKSMKSKAYIENLAKYPEMTQKLLTRFPGATDC